MKCRSLIGLPVILAIMLVLSGCGLASSGQRLSASLPNAFGLVEGTPVMLKGFEVGEITKLEARGGSAFVEMHLDDLDEPLHTGTTVGVKWASVLGHKLVELVPGPAQNPVLRDGAVIEAGSHQVLVEELLEALDEPTRKHVQGMLGQLNTTLAGSQREINDTVRDAGPAVQALGAVLNGVGGDGESIKTLVSNLRKVTEVLAARKQGISSSIVDLNRFTSQAAVHQQALSDGLKQLPGTLDQAKSTLDKVPAAAKATVPLLDDLRPATDRLPSVSRNLNGMLKNLTPALKDLPPVLKDTADLLDERVAPKFLDKANDTLPQLATAFKPEKLGNPVRFLRPYAPEIISGISNWSNAWSGYDSNGGFVVATLSANESSVTGNPADVGFPGYWPNRHVAPGINGGTPWNDANSWDTDAKGNPLK